LTNSQPSSASEDFLLIKRAVIFANGQLPHLEMARAILQQDDFILAADGGTLHVLALGRTPDVIVGDLDSLPKEIQQKMQREQVEIVLYPRDKNETDLELALNHAFTFNPSRVMIVGALGHRLDQTLGNLSLMAGPRLSKIDLRLDDGVEEAILCRDQIEVHGRSGDIVSLIPWQGDVGGVTTSGLRWPLNAEILYANKTRGISNEMTAATAAIRVKSGMLLVVHSRISGQ